VFLNAINPLISKFVR